MSVRDLAWAKANPGNDRDWPIDGCVLASDLEIGQRFECIRGKTWIVIAKREHYIEPIEGETHAFANIASVLPLPFDAKHYVDELMGAANLASRDYKTARTIYCAIHLAAARSAPLNPDAHAIYESTKAMIVGDREQGRRILARRFGALIWGEP